MCIGVRSTGASSDRLEEIAYWAVEQCPVSDAVRRAVPLSMELLD